MTAGVSRRWALGLLALLPFVPTPSAEAATIHRIHFPVETAVRFRSGFGDDRDGGARRHLGNDIMGTRLQRVLAATDGTVTKAAVSSGNAGNYLVVEAPDGWQTKYMHLNNDTPGTDDGANPAEWMFFPGIDRGTEVLSLIHI